MNRPDDELLQAYLDGQLDAAEVARVQQRLAAEPALANQLLSRSREEAIITEWARSHRANREGTEPVRRRYFPRPFVFGLAAAALAATLLVAVWTGFFRPPVLGDADEDMAELTDVSGEVFIVGKSGESTAAKAGSRLAAGQGLRTGGEGSFAVMVSDATRLELGADTSIRLSVGPPAPQGKAQRKVHLVQGSVAADVNHRQPSNPSDPMLLTTSIGEAFLESKSSFLSVPEGTRIEPEVGPPVRFRRNDGESVTVPPGWYAVALPKNPMVARPLPARQTLPRTTIEEESGPVLSVALSPDGAQIAVACADGTVKLYDTNGNLQRELKSHRQAVRCLAFSPDGSVLVSAGNDRRVQLSDPQTGKELGKLVGYKGVIDALAFSPRGDLLVTGGMHGRELPEVRIWNLATRLEVASIDHHQAGVLAVAFSPDGKLLATAGKDQMIHLVDLATLTVQHMLDGHRMPINAIAFSPDGSTLVSAGRDRTVRLWDVADGKQRSILPAQANPVRALAFSPDGRFLAAGDVAVRLYDPKTGQERLILRGHKKVITAVVFSADGKLIATASVDKTIRLWELMLDEPEPKPAE